MTMRRTVSLLATLVVACVVFPGVAAGQSTNPCAPPVTNDVACENTRTGQSEGVWGIDGTGGEPTLQGYATAMSVNKGESITFKIDTTAPGYTIDIYRIGYYGGAGARRVVTGLSHSAPQDQPSCTTSSATGLIDCGNWAASATWTVPSTAVSGLYIAHLKRTDNGNGSHITFVVRDDATNSDVLVQTSDATWQAYNDYGGNSLYQCSVACPPGDPDGYRAAYAVSYNRPFNTTSERSWWRSAEYPMIRFLEANGFDLSYTSNVDTHARGNLLGTHKVFLATGHDEYWSGAMRANVEAARDNGLNLAFFTGNEVFWRTRYAPAIAGAATPNRTLISYKDTKFQGRADPVEWTGTWKDPRFAQPPESKPENALTGQSFLVNAGSAAITVPWTYRNLRLWRGTAVASLATGQSATLSPQTLGYEWDEDPDNGFRPAGQFRLSSTTVSGVEAFVDHGTWTAIETATHNLTMHRRPSGALVFGAGTVQWSWGLDGGNPIGNAPNPTMRQATVNLLADMGVQPFAPAAGIARATKSTDTTAPTATLTSPAAGATLTDGALVTVTGTAADAGGAVAGVEVSTDGGDTWHPASGTTNWSYSWSVHGAPVANLRVRAVDDSGNLGNPGAGTSVNVSCPCSIWGSTAPEQADSGDPGAIEVGVKFRSDVYGAVSGVRFYKAAANTGTHVGSLWTQNGQRLAQATFTNETASGWQKVTFAQPVQVDPNTTYIASYHAPNGHYSATKDFLWPGPSPGPSGLSTLDAKPLHAVKNFGAVQNGLYSYSPTSTLPTSSFAATSYWVDVLFSPTPAPGAVTNVSAVAAGTTSASVSWTAPATGGAPNSYRITPYIGSTPQTPTTITGTPLPTTGTVTGLTSGETYRFSVQAVNPAGSGAASELSNAVTPLSAVVPTAPRALVVRPITGAVQVEWAAPSSDGDSPITGYTITPFADGVAQPAVDSPGTATSRKVTGLTNGTSYTFRVAARNAIGTGPASSASVPAIPQNTLYELAAPAVPDSGDTGSVELGMKFRADMDGTVTGIRFYKSALNTGTHTGTLWSSTGTPLAQATFSDESPSGWQTVTFATPVAVTAGTTYVASYHAPNGHYAVTSEGLLRGYDNAPLHALAGSTTANGVYAYGVTSTFPTNSYNAADYGVDVMFSVPKPGSVGNVAAAAAGSSSANVTWAEPTTGGTPTSYRITPYAGTTALSPTTIDAPATKKKISGLTAGTTYRFTVQASNSSGGGPVSPQSNAVTPMAAIAPGAPTGLVARPATRQVALSWRAPEDDGESPITSYTITPYIGGAAQDPIQSQGSGTSRTITGLAHGTAYTFRVKATNSVGTGPDSTASQPATPGYTLFEFTAPATPEASDANAVELGVKFRADRPGTVTGIRFYKGAGNTGTHTGSLWSATGTRLAQATFTNESPSGWQTVTFATPVAITAGTTYVASYHAPNGRYAVTGGGLATAVGNPPLQTLAGASTDNGVFAYGAASQFPASSYNDGNYWVDVTFSGDAVPGAPTGVTATAGAASATVAWSAPAGGTVTAYEVTPYVGSTAQPSKTITGTPPATTTTVTGLTPGTSYSFRVRATNVEGSGPQSAASNAVTPAGTGVPAAPTAVTSAPESEAAIVRWTPPDDGGSALTGYTVTPYAGGVAQSPVAVDAPASRATITGLAVGTSYTFRVRANSAVGSGAESAESNAVTPLRSIFGFAAPATVDGGDGGSVELGVRFQSATDGVIAGIRFYKASTNTGAHVGTLWSATGGQLARATFAGESQSGWQTVHFATPVPVTANTTYVASYHAPSGHYSVTSRAFDSAFSAPPLTALRDDSTGNGLYRYTSSPDFPLSSFNAANYWVDVLYGPPS